MGSSFKYWDVYTQSDMLDWSQFIITNKNQPSSRFIPNISCKITNVFQIFMQGKNDLDNAHFDLVLRNTLRVGYLQGSILMDIM